LKRNKIFIMHFILNHTHTKEEVKINSIGNSIKELRLRKKMTLKDVSKKTKLSIGLLSQLERNKTSVTLQSIAKISDAFGVSQSYFFQENEENNESQNIVKQNNSEKITHLNESDFVYQSLSGVINKPIFEPMIVIVLPSTITEPSTHSGQEFVYVLKGELTVILGNEETTIGPGGSFHIKSSTPHTWYNKSTDPVRLIYVHSKS